MAQYPKVPLAGAIGTSASVKIRTAVWHEVTGAIGEGR
jgi:hypothetical protein